MGNDIGSTEPNLKLTIEQIKNRREVDLKTAIAQLRQCQEKLDAKMNQIEQCTGSLIEVDGLLDEKTNPETREKLKSEKRELATKEDHLRSSLVTKKEVATQSKVTIKALHQKLLEIKKKTSPIDDEMMEITNQRKKAKDERRKKD